MATAAAAAGAPPPAYAPGVHAFAPPLDLEKGDSAAAVQEAALSLRDGFVRKVFGLVAAQLLLTALVGGGLAGFAPGLLRAGPLVFVAALASLGLVCALSFSERLRHEHPTNLLLLAALTACEGVVVGAAASAYSAAVVLAAVVLTGVVALGLSAYALTRRAADLTLSSGALVSSLLALLGASLLAVLLPAGTLPALQLLLAGGGAALFGVFIVHDVQLIAGGGSVQLSPDDYVVGALQVYLDLINLFLHLLRIVSELTQDR